MFSTKDKKVIGDGTAWNGENSIKAFLGAGSEFEGLMTFGENMRIDGKFRGEISTKELLIVGETAIIHADITVGSIIISGHLQGNITAEKQVELRAPACIHGDISTPSISIDEGVIFNGRIKMNTKIEYTAAQQDKTNISIVR